MGLTLSVDTELYLRQDENLYCLICLGHMNLYKNHHLNIVRAVTFWNTHSLFTITTRAFPISYDIHQHHIIHPPEAPHIKFDQSRTNFKHMCI